MTPDEFAGFDLDKIVRDTDAAKRLAEEAKKRAEAGKKPAPAAPIARDDPLYNYYGDVEFEEHVYHGGVDRFIWFGTSLDRIKSKKPGFERRHARPREVFSLLINGIEGKLLSGYADVYADMQTTEAEFLSLAWERQGGILTAYLDPKGLRFSKGNCIKTNKFGFTEQKKFNVEGMELKYIPLEKFSDDFVVYHYGRHYMDLPEKMRVGDDRAKVMLPRENGHIWPVIRNGGSSIYSITYCDRGASRGVTVKGAKI
jgi:hypothetical protein